MTELQDVYSTNARFYDPAYESDPRLNDIPFYLALAERQGGPVLEIACGTGRVLLAIARAGIEIQGVDLSPSLLAILERKLASEADQIRDKVTLTKADMRDFYLGRTFRLVTIPFRPLQHLAEIEDQIRALTSAKRHMARDGLLAFNVFFPNFAMLEQDVGVERHDLEWIDPENRARIWKRYFVRSSVDKLRQVFRGEFVFKAYEDGRQVDEERSPFSMSYYTYPHMLLLFRICGLEIVEQFGSFEKEPIDVCKEMIFVLRRRDV